MPSERDDVPGDEGWRLDRFESELDAWASRERIADDLLLPALVWILSRQDDPYVGVARAAGFDNLWHGPIPDTFDSTTGLRVTCSYWIDEGTRTVRCDNFGLQQP